MAPRMQRALTIGAVLLISTQVVLLVVVFNTELLALFGIALDNGDDSAVDLLELPQPRAPRAWPLREAVPPSVRRDGATP